jgi:hypothetical protein
VLGDKNMIRWNVAIYTGIGAFGLSFIIGILSGNPILAIILRAFIFGIIFTGLGAAVSFILNKYLPEIFNIDSQTVQEIKESDNVDIVLPEEGPVLGESLLEDKEKVSSDFTADEETAEELETAEEVEEKEYLNEDEDAEVVESAIEYDEIESKEDVKEYKEQQEQEKKLEEEEESENNYDNIVVEEMTRDEDENVNLSDEKEKTYKRDQYEDQTETTGEENVTNTKEITEEELDELPDMGVLENSFMVISSEGTEESDTIQGVQSKITGKITKKEDPAVYAQAVRTIIKRDEEGPKKYGR